MTGFKQNGGSFWHVLVRQSEWEIFGDFRFGFCLGRNDFLIPYVIFVILIGATGVIGEFALGRAAEAGPVGAFGMCTALKGKRKLGERLGIIPILGSLALAIGYSCVMGWIFKYTWMSIDGSMFAMQGDMEVIGSTFGKTASAGELIFGLSLLCLSALRSCLWGLRVELKKQINL